MKVLLVTPYYTLSLQHKVTQIAMADKVEVCQLIPGVYHHQPNPVLLQNHSNPRHQLVPVKLFHQFDPHRAFIASTLVGIRKFKPDLIAVEWDADTLMALQMALARRLWAPQAKLLLHSWQNVSRPLKTSVRLVLKYTLQAADAICCANQAGQALLRGWGYNGSIIYQPWLGVDTSIFYRRDATALRQALGLNGFVIGYVGRLTSEKGIDDLIRALNKVQGDIKCVLIGEGPEATALKQLAKAEGLEKRVYFLGSISNETVADYYSMLDVLVLPSRTTPVWKEQYGRVLLEAMACQVPIIGSDSGAIPEVVGQAGLIFPEGDIECLAAHIQSLYKNRQLAHQLGQVGYAQVAARYSQEQIAAQILSLYQQLVGV